MTSVVSEQVQEEKGAPSPIDIKTHPTAISPADLQQLQNNFTLNFGYGATLSYSHSYKEGQTTFNVCYDGELPEDVVGSASGVLHKGDVDGKPIYFYSASIDDTGTIKENTGRNILEFFELDVRRSREFRQRHIPTPPPSHQEYKEIILPKPISLPEIAKRLVKRKYMFFTGAGLSASVVPDWNGLMNLMGYNQRKSDKENISATLNSIINPQALMIGLHQTHKAFIAGSPADGHKAIARMCNLLKQIALTDNRDLIQQSAGTHAIHVNQLVPFAHNPWKPIVLCNATDIDGVVVCGMGGDRRGFLRWLKQNNPNVEIIHLDKVLLRNGIPTIDADYAICGDLNILLPELSLEVQKQESKSKARSLEALDLAPFTLSPKEKKVTTESYAKPALDSETKDKPHKSWVQKSKTLSGKFWEV